MARFHFQGCRLPAHSFQPHWLCQPNRTASSKSFYVLAANQGNVLTELALIQLNQAATVGRFLRAHAVKHGGRGGEVMAQALGKIAVHSLIFFFQRNCQSKYFLFRKALKASHMLPFDCDSHLSMHFTC